MWHKIWKVDVRLGFRNTKVINIVFKSGVWVNRIPELRHESFVRECGLMNTNITRKAMYAQRNIKARSCKHCSSRKAVSVTHS